ncbi:MAG: GNAT family N-acetyltransferase [Spirochaetaceae bacterium]
MTYQVGFSQGIKEIDPQQWNRLTHDTATPLLDWEWLYCLEESGSISRNSSWLPVHMTVRREDRLVAAVPLYVRTHSIGEFVFDFMWADVAEKIDYRYYPKLVGMSPATPSTGYQALVAPEEDREAMERLILSQVRRFADQNKIGTVAFNYVEESWSRRLAEVGYSLWKHQSYDWHNPGFSDFDDYLAVFTKNQRRNIRRERQAVADAGLEVEVLPGIEAPDSYFDQMYRLYLRTNDQFGPWAAKYLNRRFFEMVESDCRHRVVLVAARPQGADRREDPVAMAMLLHKDKKILGRYWGTEQFVNGLHFEVCYYAPIEWAISQGIEHFDPGMGSHHKVRRGFHAVPNYSAHRFSDPRMQAIFEANLSRFNDMEEQNIAALNEARPVKVQT